MDYRASTSLSSGRRRISSAGPLGTGMVSLSVSLSLSALSSLPLHAVTRPDGHRLTATATRSRPHLTHGHHHTDHQDQLSFFLSFSSLFSLSFFLSFSSFFSSWLRSPFLSFSLLFSNSVILYNYLFQLAICFFINSLFIHCFSTSTLCFCQFNTLLVHSTLCVYVTINHFLFNYFGLLS